jgi:putative transposase
VRNHACYLAIGINLDGERDVLEIWFERAEGAKFWLQVLTELRQRGIADVLVACVDGLTGFPDAIEAVFPQAWVQTCLVHLVRLSLRFLPYRDKRAVAADLKRIYTAADHDAADEAPALRRHLGCPLPDDQPQLARALGTDHPLPGLRARPPRGLHDQHDRGAQPADPQDHQDPRPVPDPRRRPQADLPRHHARPDQAAPRLQLQRCPGRLQNPLRRPHPRQRNLKLTPPHHPD